MKQRERNLLILLGVIAVAAAIYFVSNMTPEREYDELGLRTDSAERIADLSLSTRNMPELNIEELEEEKASFTGAKRNLFVYGEAIDESDSEEDMEEVDDEDETDVYEVPVADEGADTEPVRRTPTLAGYEYIGLHQNSDNKNPTAVFSWRGRTLVGRKGQIVNDAFEIKEITRRYVLIHVLQGDFEQRLQLKSPAGATSGGMQ